MTLLRLLLPLSSLTLSVISCTSEKSRCIDFLYQSMSLKDSLELDRSFWERNVEKTLEVRDRMKWDIPKREFMHFVLPLRVNNETLDDFRTLYADSLCQRVEGMEIAEAALEINHWCHERATYTPTDGRTIGPLGLIRSGLGRCGEESVLTVSALRAAGIPARQVYTPRWAHTDDNHAWVEVWTDGRWHFMGACEPEPVLDLGWFNSSVSRAMLLHTKVVGDYMSDEDVISRNRCYTEINCIKGYIPSIRTTVQVTDTLGNPLQDAKVAFCIYNYAEFFPVATYSTSQDGKASLDTGIGDMVIWAQKDGMFALERVSPPRDNSQSEYTARIVLDRHLGEEQTIEFEIVPPKENPLENRATAEQIAQNGKRLSEENAIREKMPHPRTDDPGLWLTPKDSVDVPTEVIQDCLEAGLTGERYIDSPRVELEMLRPLRCEVRQDSQMQQIMQSENPGLMLEQWTLQNITLRDQNNPQGLRISPLYVWRSRLADSRSRDIFFVAMCRALRCPARLDEATLRPEYMYCGEWHRAAFYDEQTQPQRSLLRLEYNRKPGCAVATPKYYYNYTLSLIDQGMPRLQEYEEGVQRSEYELESGYYMLCSGTRLASGSVIAQAHLFPVKKGEKRSEEISLPDARDRVTVIGNIDAEMTFLPQECDAEQTLLSQTGRGYFLLCITGNFDEPTIHAIRQLDSMSDTLNEWNRPIVVLDGMGPEKCTGIIRGKDLDAKIAKMLQLGTEHKASLKLPVIAVADSFGRVVYLSEGYNTSLSSQLDNVLLQL